MLSEIISFWFDPKNKENLFKKDKNFDDLIKSKFLKFFEESINSIDIFTIKTPLDCLAYIILFDQFPRNMFRDSPKSFSSDSLALSLSILAIDRGYDKGLSQFEKTFVYLPLIHSEILAIQEICVKKFKENNDGKDDDFAIRHYDIIKKFGRFPHRNSILKRVSSKEETDFLTQPNSSF